MTARHTKLGLLLLGCYLPAAHADDVSNEHRIELSPRMAAFYTIDSEGRSVPENPVVAAISSPNAGATRPSARRPVDETKMTTVPMISIQIVRRQPNSRNAATCERHGLFFTRNGRCVRPLPNDVQLDSLREGKRASRLAPAIPAMDANASTGAR